MTRAPRGLSVAMLTPAFWPEVRRGTERMVHEVTSGLLAKGHRPLVIASHPSRLGRGVEESVPVLRVPRPPDGRMRRRIIEDHLTHVPFSYAALRLGRFDVAHAWFTTDALAAGRWRRLTGRPAVLSYMGIPNVRGLRDKRGRLGLTVRAIGQCDVTVALGSYAAREFRRSFGLDTPVIHPPVDVQTFRVGDRRTDEPTIVYAAAADESRKRVDLLVRAFRLVRRSRPTARLVVNRPRDRALAEQLARAETGIEVKDMDDRSELARLYGSAWVSVLPSIFEAFGLVLAEALACGTPGVGSERDGIPEVLDRPEVGRLFSGEEDDLARALLEAMELAHDPATREACRARALDFSAENCTQAYERLYRSLLEGGSADGRH